MAPLELVVPGRLHLPSYRDALERGWSPNTVRPEVALVELAEIAADTEAYLARKTDLEGANPPLVMADGSRRPRLPGFTRWMWDGSFVGSINFRWQPGTAELPPHVLGHIGYTVVPWKRRRGHATTALRLFLGELAAFDLPYIELVTDAANRASQRVIVANGGRFIEQFPQLDEHGGGEGRRYRIPLGPVRSG